MRRRVGLVVGAAFALGFAIGATAVPAFKSGSTASAVAAVAVAGSELPPAPAAPPGPPLAKRLDPELVYPADLVRIIDGDTFWARVRVWPGIDVDTKVRLRGIDAAELHARCAVELAKAQAARAALQTILSEGGITVSRVGIDKYGGRVDAAVGTRNTADVSAAMLSGGWARAYDGRRRGSWCG